MLFRSAVFQIYEWNGSAYVLYGEKMKETAQVGIYESDWVYFSQKNQGKFRVVEETAPEGYVGNYENIENQVKKTYDFEITKEAHEKIVPISDQDSEVIFNKLQRGKIIIQKNGDVLETACEDGNGGYRLSLIHI